MMAVLGMLVFAGAFAAAGSVFAFTLVPALPRIAALLRGETDPGHVAMPMLVLSDRRLRARVRPVSATAIAARPQAFRAAA
ncbi:MAG: hypothetical protein JWN66_1829 [Sphingomonas bacterium]|nr:hypothetical protein [Sphingomonas bacterium]